MSVKEIALLIIGFLIGCISIMTVTVLIIDKEKKKLEVINGNRIKE